MISFKVDDDYGVSEVTLEEVDPQAGRDATGMVVQAWQPNRQKQLSTTWTAAQPPRFKGDTLAYRIVARDNVPGGGGERSKDSEAQQLEADKAFITVVKRQRFLKKKRFEISPNVGISVNDPFVRHIAIGAELNYWITNRLAVGLTGTGFIGNKTSRYNNIRFQEGVLLTANKVLWQASFNVLYNPFYGKIAVFNRALLHWESFIQAGGGVVQTQVIPRYEALHEPFRNTTGQGNFALGARFYGPKTDWVSVNFGVRTWIYQDKLEPTGRGPGPVSVPSYDDAATAKSNAEKKLAFNVVFFLGVSFYFPTSFQYTTRR